MSPLMEKFEHCFPQLVRFRPILDRCYDFLNIFAKKLPFLTQNKGKLCKILIITLVFEKNANFFAENCQKSQKIVIIASTPCHTVPRQHWSFMLSVSEPLLEL
jgi:hypothetical protein